MTRLGREQRRMNVDLPLWMVGALDRKARRIGVTWQSIIKQSIIKQSIIKVWLAERLEQAS